MLELNKLYLMDCMEGMKTFPDKYFDLAIVDPPYGIGKNWNKDTASNYYRHKSSYKNKPLNEDYFNNLFRISKDQIIWGANYYWNFLKPTSNIIWWDKFIDPKKHLRSAGELAWTSITKYPANSFRFSWNGCVRDGERIGIHPHEKPVQLYKWILHNYAKPDFKIIDTHAGSCSSVIAFLDYGCDWIAFEIDKDYYEAANRRIENHKLQLKLF